MKIEKNEECITTRLMYQFLYKYLIATEATTQ